MALSAPATLLVCEGHHAALGDRLDAAEAVWVQALHAGAWCTTPARRCRAAACGRATPPCSVAGSAASLDDGLVQADGVVEAARGAGFC